MIYPVLSVCHVYDVLILSFLSFELAAFALGRMCLSHVKVVLRDVLGRVDLHACVSGCKLVT